MQKHRGPNVPMSHLNLGGGFGIAYQDDAGLDLPALGQSLQRLFNDQELTLLFEPGRSLVGPAGVLLTRVTYVKNHGDKRFIIVDRCSQIDTKMNMDIYKQFLVNPSKFIFDIYHHNLQFI